MDILNCIYFIKLSLFNCHRSFIQDAHGKTKSIIRMDALLAQHTLGNRANIFIYQSYIIAISAFPSNIKGSVLTSITKIHHRSKCTNNMCALCSASNRLHMGRQNAFISVTFIKIM